jgi:cobalt/nickel transport system permease protein
MEGFLPLFWCLIWFAVSIPVITFGVYKLNKLVKERREILPILAVSGAFSNSRFEQKHMQSTVKNLNSS